MRLIIGAIIVFACVFGSYAAMGGHLEVLWQPFEFVIILGAAIGAFIIGNTGAESIYQTPLALMGPR